MPSSVRYWYFKRLNDQLKEEKKLMDEAQREAKSKARVRRGKR